MHIKTYTTTLRDKAWVSMLCPFSQNSRTLRIYNPEKGAVVKRRRGHRDSATATTMNRSTPEMSSIVHFIPRKHHSLTRTPIHGARTREMRR